ncbi:hypothetical protein AYI68_g8181 [Smittium mucronatum]|uniref:Uncharacterized protein n=1 Tax=Smittium mucronatum TaxID=133383 RepID=A0A1R0GLK1_9FUNG|nr:hypothetical protein AYI68_g8181 [Smittium mucronatum]
MGSTQGSQQTPECCPEDIKMSSELYRKGKIYANSSALGEAYVTTTARAEESISLQYEIMDVDGNNIEASAPEPAILEIQTDFMEWSLILSSDPRIGYLYGFQHSGGPESGQRMDKHDASHKNVEIYTKVSGSGDIFNIANFGAENEQALKEIDIEDQRSLLEAQDLGTHAVDCILSKEQRVKRRSNHSSIKQSFIDWRISYKITTPISATQIIN